MLHVVLKNALFRKGKDLVRVCERVSLSSSQGRGLAKALGVGKELSGFSPYTLRGSPWPPILLPLDPRYRVVQWEVRAAPSPGAPQGIHWGLGHTSTFLEPLRPANLCFPVAATCSSPDLGRQQLSLLLSRTAGS